MEFYSIKMYLFEIIFEHIYLVKFICTLSDKHRLVEAVPYIDISQSGEAHTYNGSVKRPHLMAPASEHA